MHAKATRFRGGLVNARRPPRPCSGASSVTVHVYALPPEFEKEITSEYRQCEKSQWAFEVHLPRMFRRLPKMKSPDNADFYLVPFPVKCYNNFVALYDKSLVDKHFTKLIHWLNVTHPWFQKVGGGITSLFSPVARDLLFSRLVSAILRVVFTFWQKVIALG